MNNAFIFDAVKRAGAGQWSVIIRSLAAVEDSVLAGQHGPCPVCGGTDRFRVFDDFEVTGGSICNQCGAHADGISTLAWLRGWSPVEAARNIADHLGIDHPRNGHVVPKNGQHTPRTEGATDPEFLHQVYQALIDATPLAETDRQCLRDRGLNNNTIDRNGYATLDAGSGQQTAQSVLESVGCTKSELVTVPGFVRENGNVTLAAWLGPGILIPCRGLDGLIRAIKVRRQQRRGDQAKYVSLSGGKKHGQNAGAHCHVPVGTPSTCETVRVTEGELKSDVSFALSELPTIGVPGISQWRTALPVIEQLSAQHVLIAYDAPEYDDDSKTTARDATAFARELMRLGYAVEIEVWQAEAGKGIDDVMAAGNETSAMTLDELLSLRPDLVEVAHVGDVEHEENRSLKPISIGELIDTHPTLKPPVLDGLLRAGETCNIIAAPKVGKSWLVYGLLLCVVTGRRWMNTFETVAGPVLLIDNELHPPTIANRLKNVARTLGIPSSDYNVAVDVVSLRGRLTDYHGLGGLVDRIEGGHYRLIVVDAHYRMIPAGVSENDNAGMAAVYNLIDQFAGKTDAAWVLIHHASKGQQGDKAVTDVGAGAGAQSRAADTHLVLREHQEPGHVVLDAAVRSFPPIASLVLRWVFPVWVLADGNVDPSKLVGATNRQEVRQAKKDREGQEQVLNVLGELQGATMSKLKRETGISKERMDRLLGQLKSKGAVTTTDVNRRGNKCRCYHLPDVVGE